MEQFIYLGETVWRVAPSDGALDYGRYLGELRDVPRGPHAPGDWFVLAVRSAPEHRRWMLVAVDSLRTASHLAENRSGDDGGRGRRRLGDVAGMFRRAQRRNTEPGLGEAASPVAPALGRADRRPACAGTE